VVVSLALAIILAITYGYNADGPQDKLVQLAETVITDLERVLEPGAYLVDSIPIRECIVTYSSELHH
jgi:tetrahydromethanopterin S-methyltransferase subunit B